MRTAVLPDRTDRRNDVGEKLRVVCVVPGREDDTQCMPFVRRQIDSLVESGVDAIPFYLPSRTSPVSLFRHWRRLRAELRRIKPDLLHAQYGTVTAFLAALAADVPLVISFRGSDLNPAPGANRWRNRVARLLSQLAALRASAIVCVSDTLRSRLWWRQTRAVAIPNGVDLRLFQPGDCETARAKLDWTLEECVVLVNVRTDPVGKRLDLAEAVMQIVKESIPAARLEVLRGTIPPAEMPTLYNAADCLLMTSDYEGSPNVVKEALACNLPVVSVDVGDVAERLEGVNHSSVVERDAHRLAEAVIDVLRLRRRSDGREAAGRISEQEIAKRIIEVYEQALNRPRASEARETAPKAA